jgi:hypothetical protein
MGKQRTKAIFLGTCANLNGYVDDGKPFARLVDRRDRRKAGALAASKLFGRVSADAAVTWRAMPSQMRRLGGESAYNEWVSACLGLAREGSFHWDWSALAGLRFGVGNEMNEGEAAIDSEAFSSSLAKGKLNLSGELLSLRQVLAPYRNGVDARWRLAAMPRRDGHYDLGMQFAPHRGPAQRYEGSAKDKAWNAQFAKGLYQGIEPEFVDHFGASSADASPLLVENFRSVVSRGESKVQGAIRARFWLHLITPSDGKGCGVCSDWCDLDAVDGLALDICSLRDWQRGLGADTTVLAFLGVEVSEKRGRHWVRLPFACGLRVLGEVVFARGDGRVRAADRGRVRGLGFGRFGRVDERSEKRAGKGYLSHRRFGELVDLGTDLRAGLHPALGDCALSGLFGSETLWRPERLTSPSEGCSPLRCGSRTRWRPERLTSLSEGCIPLRCGSVTRWRPERLTSLGEWREPSRVPKPRHVGIPDIKRHY